MTMMETSTKGVSVSLVPRCLCWPRLDKLRGEQEREREREFSHRESTPGRATGRATCSRCCCSPRRKTRGKEQCRQCQCRHSQLRFQAKVFFTFSFFFLLISRIATPSASLSLLLQREMSSSSLLQARALSSAAASTTAPRRTMAMARKAPSSTSAAAASSRFSTAALPSSCGQRGSFTLPASPFVPSRSAGRRRGNSHVVAVSYTLLESERW